MPKFKASVIGDPISHSLSPTIHNFLLSKHQIDGEYNAVLVKKDELKSFIKTAIENDLAGFNITIPHKEEIFKICDYKSKTASLTGAVNTVVITQDKKVFGHNSDGEGFINHLKNSINNYKLNGKIAFVIGAGGAARAIVYALIKEGVKEIYITNRSESRAQELIKNFADFAVEKKCHLHFVNKKTFEENLIKSDLLVNSSSLGMTGQEPLEIDLKNLNQSAVVFDIVYKPLMTNLLKTAQSRGNKIVTGLGMLVFQALVGFELWFKQKPDEKFVKELFKNL
jgi:shikimate dehydrogenase